MQNIFFLYKILLLKNKFYYIYFRIFLLFFSEKNKKDIFLNLKINNISPYITKINKKLYYKYNNIDIFKNTIKVFIIDGIKIFAKKCLNFLELVNIKKNFINFLKYKIFNNITFIYILNFLFLKKKINIITKKNITIINIYTKKFNNKNISLIKNIKIKKNLNIIDFYTTKSLNSNIMIDTSIDIAKNIKTKYLLVDKSKKINNIYLNFNFNQKYNSILFFSDYISSITNAEIFYNFFLMGKKSILKKKSFKKCIKNNIDIRICNIYHYNNNTICDILFGAILNNKSNLIFNGNIFVAKEIKNITSALKCEGLILSDKAHIELNPNMFINNSEVKCSHGASIGNISENVLNYMRSRGINNIDCKKILIKTFKKKFLKKNILKIKNL